MVLCLQQRKRGVRQKGLDAKRLASSNDLPIQEKDRKFK
jgi:nuclear transport factor 2 (NTF2) superfamily protein